MCPLEPRQGDEEQAPAHARDEGRGRRPLRQGAAPREALGLNYETLETVTQYTSCADS